MNPPPHDWYIACRSDRLRHRPLPITIHGQRLALFRTAEGVPAALSDRCAHRNAPLSLGRIQGNHIQCGYHGWEFDRSGSCRKIPGLADIAGTKGRDVPSFRVAEQQGYVWVHLGPTEAPSSSPFRFPDMGDSSYGLIRYRTVFDAPAFYILENFLDVPHTAFLHRGLFRTSAGRAISVTVRRLSDRVEARYKGEPKPTGLIGSLLASGTGEVTHVDRFFSPSISQIEYRLGESHIIETTALTPENEGRTRLFMEIVFRLRIPKTLAFLLAGPVLFGILRQDARIVSRQYENVRRFGEEKFSFTPIDVLGPHILALWKSQTNERLSAAASQIEQRLEIVL